MPRYPIIALTILLAAPALAHEGAHLHPHASDPAWWPVLAGTLAMGTAGLLAWVRR